MNVFAKAIDGLLKELDISLNKLSKMTGVAYPTLQRMVKGETTKVRKGTLEKLADGTGRVLEYEGEKPVFKEADKHFKEEAPKAASTEAAPAPAPKAAAKSEAKAAPSNGSAKVDAATSDVLEQIRRSYDRIEQKLDGLGALLTRRDGTVNVEALEHLMKFIEAVRK